MPSSSLKAYRSKAGSTAKPFSLARGTSSSFATRRSGKASAAMASFRRRNRSASVIPTVEASPMARSIAPSVSNRWPTRRLWRRASASVV